MTSTRKENPSTVGLTSHSVFTLNHSQHEDLGIFNRREQEFHSQQKSTVSQNIDGQRLVSICSKIISPNILVNFEIVWLWGFFYLHARLGNNQTQWDKFYHLLLKTRVNGIPKHSKMHLREDTNRKKIKICDQDHHNRTSGE